MDQSIDVANITGKAMKFGDAMNTDIIIPSKYLEFKDPNDYCKYVMAAVRPSTWQEIQDQGPTIFVGGEDFGSGSSREQAPDAIIYAGVGAVVAESFATIFFRNCVNVGLPLLQIDSVTSEVSEGDELRVNLEEGTLENLTTGKTLHGKPLEGFLLDKMRMGGLIPELQQYVKDNQLD
ncbi:MAG: LeuD/DmdB family oxidoreductase small subunit [Candidatus Kariarchaeaceae archaeon]|jgi:3-isopropylmalate/(R)-2-methylmalate dehydratase small subunit